MPNCLNFIGIRNYAVGTFSGFEFRSDKGKIFENFVYLCLKKEVEIYTPIYFWRKKAGAEVDFVLTKGLIPVPIESKAAEMKDFKITRSLRSFINTYNPKNTYCVNLSLSSAYKHKKASIYFLKPIDLIKKKFV